MTTISHGTVTTRKPHRCCYCDLMIEVGSRAVSHTYRDGGIVTSHAHADCQAATEWARWDWDDYEAHGDPAEFCKYPLGAYLESKTAAVEAALKGTP